MSKVIDISHLKPSERGGVREREREREIERERERERGGGSLSRTGGRLNRNSINCVSQILSPQKAGITQSLCVVDTHKLQDSK